MPQSKARNERPFSYAFRKKLTRTLDVVNGKEKRELLTET
jgi:hypothetical protein